MRKFTDKKVVGIVGWIIILGHLLVAFLCVFRLSPLLNNNQLLGVLLALGPVATTYFATIVVSFIDERYESQRAKKVSNNFAYVAILLPVVFMGCLISIILGYPFGIAREPAALQKWISGVEIALGGTVGYLVSTLFAKKKE